MSSKRSDSLAAAPPGVLPYSTESPISAGWWTTLRANWSIPFALLAVVLVGRFVVETRWFGRLAMRWTCLEGSRTVGPFQALGLRFAAFAVVHQARRNASPRKPRVRSRRQTTKGCCSRFRA